MCYLKREQENVSSTVLHVVWHGCEIWSVILREEHMQRVFQ